MKLPTYSKVLAAAMLTLLLSTHSNAQKLYKWVDAQGNISYQDQPPPENAKVLDQKDVGDSKGPPTPATTDPIKIYTVDNCAVCAQAVLHMIKMGVPHVELPLSGDREAQSLILEKTSSLIAPTILIGDQVLQAPTNDELTEAIKAAGYALPDSA